MRHPSLNVSWSIRKGIQSLQVPDSSYILTRKNIKITRGWIRKTLRIKILYHGEIISNPVWNDELVKKIIIKGERMSRTRRKCTIIEGIQINFHYVE